MFKNCDKNVEKSAKKVIHSFFHKVIHRKNFLIFGGFVLPFAQK